MGFFIIKGKDELYYWHLKAANGEILAHSEGYRTKQNAEVGIHAAISVVMQVTGRK